MNLKEKVYTSELCKGDYNKITQMHTNAFLEFQITKNPIILTGT